MVIAADRTVLLVHGLGDTKDNTEKSRIYSELKKYFNVHAIDYLSGPDNAYGDIRDYAKTLDEIIETTKSENQVKKVDIVAHSMGGLISRFRIQKIKDYDIDKLIMIGTPNHGSDFSRQIPFNILQFFINPSYAISLVFNEKYQSENPNQAINQMLPGSDFLFELNGNYASELDVSKGGVLDNISTNVKYAVISGSQLATFSSDRKGFVKGDGIVPFNSAKLSNVPIFPVSALHGDELNSKEIAALVVELLVSSDTINN